ncbi:MULTISPECIES: 16S rRNA (uracil(1498)-N(3))-methyltransferase [unclassified Meiothermus]|uniref:16S rRNA (uracil(1498)-N(3))-methyltransferase n=1 Tax=unclassified Meiothermus TaxID=370471 RepID=UPI000D7C6291|nr:MULTISPECIES: 16S rRNA (uracil(1498)-N(3))-methyltransferase [unclassified Meiothermus]PZA06996.1 16S rRNA (uracil(1498)-N(3))-methyltransferase [Meiothermus sp. Pnk-1]RYM35302.1 16S rRNA (uracil(1498)-N(3))-methyltransferase [Meiothermus sp. PNK-Is4]
MRPHRAFAPKLAPLLTLTGREARHLAEVLRARPGDTLTVFDGEGLEGRAVVRAVEGGVVELEVTATWPASREVPVPVVLYVALLKGDKLADVVRAATELGATRIIPLVCVYSVPKEIGEGKLLRLRRVALEAAKQSGRTTVPEVLAPIPLSAIPPVEQGLAAHPGSAVRVRDVLDLSRPITLATGPEGGFSEDEMQTLTERGFTPVTLGQRILRAETAPLALLSLVTAGEGV